VLLLSSRRDGWSFGLRCFARECMETIVRGTTSRQACQGMANGERGFASDGKQCILRFMDTGTRRRSAQLRLRRLCACSRARLLLLCLQLDTTEYRPYEYEYAPLDGNAVQGG
jgi:hypothetical protein